MGLFRASSAWRILTPPESALGSSCATSVARPGYWIPLQTLACMTARSDHSISPCFGWGLAVHSQTYCLAGIRQPVRSDQCFSEVTRRYPDRGFRLGSNGSLSTWYWQSTCPMTCETVFSGSEDPTDSRNSVEMPSPIPVHHCDNNFQSRCEPLRTGVPTQHCVDPPSSRSSYSRRQTRQEPTVDDGVERLQGPEAQQGRPMFCGDDRDGVDESQVE